MGRQAAHNLPRQHLPIHAYGIPFLPAVDLMTMLIKYEIFSEDITRFYMAEITLAIEAVHKLGFIHRDIKPDNILQDAGVDIGSGA